MKCELEITRNQYIIIVHSLNVIYTDILSFTINVKYFVLYHMQISFFINVLSMSINAGIIICPSCPSIIHNDSMFGCIEQCIRIAIRFFVKK